MCPTTVQTDAPSPPSKLALGLELEGSHNSDIPVVDFEVPFDVPFADPLGVYNRGWQGVLGEANTHFFDSYKMPFADQTFRFRFGRWNRRKTSPGLYALEGLEALLSSSNLAGSVIVI